MRAMQAALRQARCLPKDLSCILAHGTGTRAGDAAEATALEGLLQGERVPVTAVKSMTGHLCGASGALEVIAAIRAIAQGVIPPTTNLYEPDCGNELELVAREAREASVEAVLCNAFGFGGANSCVVVRRY